MVQVAGETETEKTSRDRKLSRENLKLSSSFGGHSHTQTCHAFSEYTAAFWSRNWPMGWTRPTDKTKYTLCPELAATVYKSTPACNDKRTSIRAHDQGQMTPRAGGRPTTDRLSRGNVTLWLHFSRTVWESALAKRYLAAGIYMHDDADGGWRQFEGDTVA